MADNARAMPSAPAAHERSRAVSALRVGIGIAARSDAVQCGLWGFLIAFIATGGLL